MNVNFATSQRIHVSLEVANLDRSIAFYRILFGQEPTKIRPRYAKFAVADPGVNLALNETSRVLQDPVGVAHFGVEVKSVEAVTEATRRFEDAGLAIRVEQGVACCFAVQNKVWVCDPDGNRWEVFVVLNSGVDEYASQADECCSDTGTGQECCSPSEACCDGAAG